MVGEILQILEIVVLVATGGYVGYQAQRHFSLTRAQHYIERFNSGEMRELRSRVNSWIDRGRPLETIYPAEAPLDDEAQRDLEALRLFSSFFQELGTAYKHGTVNRAYIWDVFGRLILTYGKELAPFVCESRIQVNRSVLYIDFEYLAEDIQKMDAKKQKSARSTNWFNDHLSGGNA
jgi:hypothetical protein